MEKLSGDFAFAIWDAQQKRLMLARDRMGVKPLYYTVLGQTFLFASEIKALLEHEQVPRAIDREALSNYFSFRFVPEERTGFEGIFKLRPGHMLTVQAGKVRIEKYAGLSYKESEQSEEECATQVREHVLGAVQRQLMSDVPLGAYIGGGIDSGAIIAAAAQATDKPLDTFTLGFAHESDKVNEYGPASQVAEHFQTNHHVIEMQPDAVRELPKIIWHLDEPMADPSVVTQYVLSREAKKKVTVVLSGEGGDEIFGGYEQYRLLPKLQRYSRLVPLPLQLSLLGGLQKLLPNDTFFTKLHNFAASMQDSPMSYLELISVFDRAEKEMLFTQKMNAGIAQDTDLAIVRRYFSNSFSLLNKMLLTDTRTLLPNNLLMNVDKLGLAFGLEGRVPLLDSELVSYASSIPSHLKVRGSNEKYILKKAMQPLLPRAVTQRRKQRFHVPLDTWHALYLKEFSKDLLTSREFTSLGLIDPWQLQKLLDYQSRFSYKALLKHHPMTRLYYARQVWTLTVFGLWQRIFMEGEKPEALL